MMSRHWHRQQCSFALLRAALHPRRAEAENKAAPAIRSSKDAEDRSSQKTARVDSASSSSSSSSTTTPAAAAAAGSDKARTLPRSFSGSNMPSRSNIDGKADAKKGGAAAGSASSSGPWILRDICSTGHIRLIGWSLLHEKEEIRLMGAEVRNNSLGECYSCSVTLFPRGLRY
jgi:hypothetical protein